MLFTHSRCRGVVYHFSQDNVKVLDQTTAGILASVDSFTINQRVKWWETLSLGCFEQRNTYDIFDKATGTHLFVAQEQSADCERCWCKPYQSLRIEFYLVNSQERQWVKGGMPQYNLPVVMTADREGCCGAKPCLWCFACTDSCQDSMVVHAGKQDEATRGNFAFTEQTFGFIDQPTCGGFCKPTFNVHYKTQSASSIDAFSPLATMVGPCCFGGWTQFCFESEFNFYGAAAEKTHAISGGTPKLAKLTKKKPAGWSACAKELFTDADVYTVDYAPNVGLTPQQKANMMASIILTDFHLFEEDNGICKFEHNAVKCTLWECYCCGCLIPCNIVLTQGQNGGGG